MAKSIYTNKDYINIISKETGLQKIDVESVLQLYIDLLVEHYMTTGFVDIPGLVKMYAMRTKKEKDFFGDNDKPERNIEQRARVSLSLRRMFMDFGPHTGKVGFVNRHNWKDIRYWINDSYVKGTYERDYTDNGYEYEFKSKKAPKTHTSNVKKKDNNTTIEDTTIDLMDELFD